MILGIEINISSVAGGLPGDRSTLINIWTNSKDDRK
jgi:hypothetical protein